MELPNHPPRFFCEKCNFKTNNKKDNTRHLLTIKHLRQQELPNLPNLPNLPILNTILYCECGKEFINRTGLWRHKKKCNVEKNENVVLETENKVLENNNVMNLMFAILKQNNEFKELIMEKTPTANSDDLVAELLKQNNEFKELMLEQSKYMMEQNKTMMELASKVRNINCNNKTFNLNFYLNDTCKDAINIFDFTKSIGLKLTDLEYTSKYGFVAGITNILLRGLKEIDVNKRPFNCSDIKREIIYVKDNGVWEKDDENKSKMVKAIKQISHRNFLQIEEWRNKNPSSRDVESKKNTEYLYIMREVLGGPTTNNDANSYNKIIRNIMKEILIDK